MTRPLCFAACALFVGILAGCLSDGPDGGPGLEGYFKDDLAGLDPMAKLDSSGKALELMKASSGESYTYSVPLYSPLSGYASRTDITVKRGMVVKRRYSSTFRDSAGRTVTGPAYTEIARVGANEAGAPAVTLDSLYAECRTCLAQADSTGTLWFALDRNYILSACGFAPHGLQDVTGPEIGIDWIKWEGK
jgi:hypothetical protein